MFPQILNKHSLETSKFMIPCLKLTINIEEVTFKVKKDGDP